MHGLPPSYCLSIFLVLTEKWSFSSPRLTPLSFGPQTSFLICKMGIIIPVSDGSGLNEVRGWHGEWQLLFSQIKWFLFPHIQLFNPRDIWFLRPPIQRNRFLQAQQLPSPNGKFQSLSDRPFCKCWPLLTVPSFRIVLCLKTVEPGFLILLCLVL